MVRRMWYIALAVLLFGVFCIFSYLVHKDVFTSFDFDTTVRIQDHMSRKVDEFFSTFSLLGSVEVIGVTLLITVSFGVKKLRRFLILLLFPVFHIVEVIGKTMIEHPGPPFMFHRYAFQFSFPSSYVNEDFFSYPSGHVGRTAFLVTILILIITGRKLSIERKIGASVLLTSFLLIMMISRIYLGEHWTSDTIGGVLLGSAFGFAGGVLW